VARRSPTQEATGTCSCAATRGLLGFGARRKDPRNVEGSRGARGQAEVTPKGRGSEEGGEVCSV